MTVIQRYRLIRENIELPEGYLVCSKCKGAGMFSKYDQGFTSVLYREELAAKIECRACNGEGYVPKG